MRPVVLLRSVLLVCACLPSACETSTGSEGDEATNDSGFESDSDGGGTSSGGEESLVGPVCAPRAGDDTCGTAVRCCSTDAAALDFMNLDARVLPNGSGSVPLFSDANNALSFHGVCVPEGDVPAENQLSGAPGCPRPCNPQWSSTDVMAACGGDFVCCQVVEIRASDCVLDPALGDAGCWRPAAGTDIGSLSTWAVDEHETHQDPGLAADGSCETLVDGLPPELDPAQVRAACHARLGVASTQGVCLPSTSLITCPYADPAYRDACETMNDDEQRSGCA